MLYDFSVDWGFFPVYCKKKKGGHLWCIYNAHLGNSSSKKASKISKLPLIPISYDLRKEIIERSSVVLWLKLAFYSHVLMHHSHQWLFPSSSSIWAGSRGTLKRLYIIHYRKLIPKVKKENKKVKTAHWFATQKPTYLLKTDPVLRV